MQLEIILQNSNSISLLIVSKYRRFIDIIVILYRPLCDLEITKFSKNKKLQIPFRYEGKGCYKDYVNDNDHVRQIYSVHYANLPLMNVVCCCC